MRINYISPEYKYTEVNGTLSQLEKKSFNGSKLLKFTDNINILNENIIYYETVDNEQLNIDIEKLLNPTIYNTVGDKANYTFIKDNTQLNTQLNTNTSWILTINYKKLLINYLFATLKSFRTFEGVQNNMTLNNSVDLAINDYINNNILSRYTFSKIDLFVSYNNLLNGGLRFQNTFDYTIENSNNLTNKYNIKNDNTNLIINFNQIKNSTEYSFNYYYNLYFNKI